METKDALLQSSLKNGVIRHSGDNFDCNVCEQPLGQQPLQHLRGAPHEKKLFSMAYLSPNKLPALGHTVPSEIRAAKKDGIIQSQDGVNFSCELCKKSGITGKIPLMSHLSGEQHKKKSQSLTPKISYDGINQPPSRASPSPIAEIILDALQSNVVKMLSPDNFECLVCSVGGMVGESTVIQHLSGKAHAKKVKAGYLIDQFRNQPPNQNQLGTLWLSDLRNTETLSNQSYGTRSQSSLLSDPFVSHQSYRFHQNAPNLLNPSAHEQNLQHFSNLQIEQSHNFYRHQQQMENQLINNPYGLNDVPLHSPQTRYTASPSSPTDMEQAPLMSSPSTHFQQYNPIRHYTYYKTNTNPFSPFNEEQQVNMTLDHHEQKPEETSYLRMMLGESSGVDQRYEIESSPRGLVVVFNYIFKENFAGRHSPREGAEYDSVKLKQTFENLNYEVIVYEDKTAGETLQYLDHIIESKLRGKSVLVLVFLSHGGQTNFDGALTTVDGSIIEVSDIWLRLSDSKCCAMKGKPKLMFLNFCRGPLSESPLQYDNVKDTEVKEAPRDLAIIHSSLPRFEALRKSESGTMFIKSLCEIIKEYAHTEDLMGIVKLLNDLMRIRHATTVEMRNIRFDKKFYFI